MLPFYRAFAICFFLIAAYSSSKAQSNFPYDSIVTVQWAKYIGGYNTDQASAVARDGLGNIFVAGATLSPNNIALNAFDSVIHGHEAGFLAKYSPSGEKLWATYFSGSGDGYDACSALAIDSHGNVVITGVTGGYNNDLAYNGFQSSYGGGLRDAFVAKFDTNGNRIWASYLGGNDLDTGLGVVIASGDDIYITGMTGSTSGLAKNGPDISFGGYYDAFLTKISSFGQLLWSSYYGGDGMDKGTGLILDKKGNVLLLGTTWSATEIADQGFDTILNDGVATEEDAFLVKFDSNGNRIWGTYFGGNSVEYGQALVTDSKGNIFISGLTYSDSNVAYNGYDLDLGGYYDGFLAKFDSAGQRVWSTYIGGANEDQVSSVCLDEKDNVYIAGSTFSPDGIAFNGFIDVYTKYPFSANGFIGRYRNSGELVWSSYYYGQVFGITAKAESMWIGGMTSDSTIAVHDEGNTFGGDNEAFFTKLNSVWSKKAGHIMGNIFFDTNGNCIPDTDEKPASNFKLTTSPGDYTGTSDSLGNYMIDVEKGKYILKETWSSCVNLKDSLTIKIYGDTVLVNIPVNLIASVEPLPSRFVTVYPNPSHTQVYLNLPEDYILFEVTLSTSQGAVISSCIPLKNEGDYEIDLSEKPGLYVMIIKTSAGEFHRKLLVY